MCALEEISNLNLSDTVHLLQQEPALADKRAVALALNRPQAMMVFGIRLQNTVDPFLRGAFISGARVVSHHEGIVKHGEQFREVAVLQLAQTQSLCLQNYRRRISHQVGFAHQRMSSSMSLVHAIAIPVGILIIAAVLFDLFASVIVPRPVPSRLLVSAYLRRFTWLAWSRLFFDLQPPRRREIVLGFFAPASVVMLLGTWLFGLIIGYGLVFFGFQAQKPLSPTLWEASYLAGSAVLNSGGGNAIVSSSIVRIVTLAAGVTGLATVAIVLAFLFSLFNSYRQRELFLVVLDARAGAPPSGVALLETHAQLDIIDDLPRFFISAQAWCGDVLETHLAYPVLCYFRSTHVGESWIAGLGAILDAATLVVSTIESVPKGQAQLAHSVGAHLVDDVADYFGLLGTELSLVERQEFVTARERLAAAGYTLGDEAQTWEAFRRLRATYASALNNLARYWVIDPAQWIGDRSPLGTRHD